MFLSLEFHISLHLSFEINKFHVQSCWNILLVVLEQNDPRVNIFIGLDYKFI